MALKFNPLTGNFDFTGSGGGGASYIDGEVSVYTDLSLDAGVAPLNTAWLVRTASGVWPVSRKQAGIYIRTATGGSSRDADYTYAGTLPDVFSDAQFVVYDDADTSKNLQFQLSSLTTATTRTLTVPDASGTLALTTTAPASHVHGNITNAGLVGTTSGLPLKTGSAGVVEAGAFGTTAGTFAEGNDSRFHTRSHAVTSTSDHTAGNWSVFHSNGSGQLVELALGANGTILTSAGTTSAPTFSTPAAGGTKTYAVFAATDNQPTASSFATLDTRNSIAVLDYDDAATESAVFVGTIPEAASLGSGLIVRLHFMATTATSGNVRWSVAFERSNTDLDADSFDTATAATVATNGTSGIVTVSAITCTTIDSVTAGDLFRVRVQRLGADAADTMTGDAELVAVEIRSAA